ncbi:MAG: hypothetical protein QW507_02810 [Candidatus Nanoarchaeia archaeon]|nr:hypothetical protein [Candidatus Haiyanarchaeum thermophilum]MCW1307234.1 hypothetical protein [Candidatus Haiyanarchaeum thermophilum]MCW1308914.1 hypothetical protein [Candidatus Haiyanarchaeum thermophilum]
MEEDYFIRIGDSPELLRKAFKLDELVRELRANVEAMERFRELRWSRKLLILEKFSEIEEILEDLLALLPEKEEKYEERKEGKVEIKTEVRPPPSRKIELEKIREELLQLQASEEKTIVAGENFKLLTDNLFLLTKNLENVDFRNLMDENLLVSREKVEEKVREFLKLVEMNKRVSLSEASRVLGIDRNILNEWGRVLVENNILALEHPIIGEPVFKLR